MVVCFDNFLRESVYFVRFKFKILEEVLCYFFES